MTQAGRRRQFSSTEHLASEAVAAYVDGELQMAAYMRASQHMAQCHECTAAVDAQQHARGALRRSAEISMPSGLLGLLSQIPMCTPPVDPDAAGGPGTDSQFGRTRAAISARMNSYSASARRRFR
ncbi:RNA polymerase subunit sigma-70 [Rhodococcus kronopolitis]|uniref:RNA polymerase subunit sigma-70 n=1 Tax=Rhodococcus kronopolitis TaxID=1460226 RepID=A0ABV9FWN6_9NOCA